VSYERRIAVADGKYTFLVPPNDYKIHVLRYGEPWLVIEDGSNAIWWLIAELIGAKALAEAVREWVGECTAEDAKKWTEFGPGANRHAALVEAFFRFQEERGEASPPAEPTP
jgi:hypothetical protein